MEGFVLKGYGESINYRMGLPLLKDVVQSMEEAIIAKEGDYFMSPAKLAGYQYLFPGIIAEQFLVT